MTAVPSPHVIRLRGFWTAEPLPDGRTRHTRRFGRPGHLSAGETVYVTADLPAGARVTVNGVVVGETVASGPAAFQVSGELLARNELAVEAAGDFGEAGLEIRG